MGREEPCYRTCYACDERKELDLFRNEPGGKKGNLCKACNAARSAKWRAENRERFLKQMKDAYDPDRARDYTLQKLYGITLSQYREACATRDNRCDICSHEPGDGILRVDHNHDTGVVRGYLCDRCNRAIGLFGDDPNVMRSAADYLDIRGSYGALKFKGSSGTVTTIANA